MKKLLKLSFIALYITLVSCKNTIKVAINDPTKAPSVSYLASSGIVNNFLTIPPSTFDDHAFKVTSCSVSPALPAGLFINNSTCEISGTPTTSISRTSYSVTATNAAGAKTSTLLLNIHQFSGIPFAGFGNVDGSVNFDIGPDYTSNGGATYFKDYLLAVVPQSDGKILICGETARAVSSGPIDGYIARLNSDGSFDTSFNTTGKYIYNSPFNSRDSFYDIKIFNNYIYAFGYSRSSNTGASNRAVILRLNMNGTEDTTFGTNGAVFQYTAGDNAVITKGEILASGKIIIYGYNIIASVRQYYIARLNVDGSMDTSFATAGTYYYPSLYTTTEGKIAVDSSGRILATFHSGNTTDYKTTVIRLTADGVLDTTYATNGVYILTLSTKNYPRNFKLVNDKVVLLGNAYDPANATIFSKFILKLDENGIPVTSWGTSGLMDYVSNPLFTNNEAGNFEIYNDQIIIAGIIGNTFTLVSLDLQTGNGTTGFGTNGIYQSSIVAPNTKLAYMTIDPTTKTLWASGIADTTSSNQLIHLIKFK